jgi:hypothetical protein
MAWLNLAMADGAPGENSWVNRSKRCAIVYSAAASPDNVNDVVLSNAWWMITTPASCLVNRVCSFYEQRYSRSRLALFREFRMAAGGRYRKDDASTERLGCRSTAY